MSNDTRNQNVAMAFVCIKYYILQNIVAILTTGECTLASTEEYEKLKRAAARLEFKVVLAYDFVDLTEEDNDVNFGGQVSPLNNFQYKLNIRVIQAMLMKVTGF